MITIDVNLKRVSVLVDSLAHRAHESDLQIEVNVSNVPSKLILNNFATRLAEGPVGSIDRLAGQKLILSCQDLFWILLYYKPFKI